MQPYDWSDLRELYINQGLSMPQIAAIKGCAMSSVLRRLRSIKVERRPRIDAFRKALSEGRVGGHFRVPLDIAELKRLYLEQGLSFKEIGKLKGVDKGTLEYRFKKLGIPTRSASEVHKLRCSRGQMSNLWRGGIRKGREGYVAIYSPNHPYHQKSNCVFEHRLVMITG
jgi:transcriptional regulator with XRE-family HTH domain